MNTFHFKNCMCLQGPKLMKPVLSSILSVSLAFSLHPYFPPSIPPHIRWLSLEHFLLFLLIFHFCIFDFYSVFVYMHAWCLCVCCQIKKKSGLSKERLYSKGLWGRGYCSKRWRLFSMKRALTTGTERISRVRHKEFSLF